MTSTLSHRGPDDEGLWQDESAGVGLGNRRLAVIDLSAEGHQPMVSRSGRYVLTFNGEIYNHVELRTVLAAQGHRFQGHADTEVLLALMDAVGARPALERAVGQFALGIWDAQERAIYLARDRMGEKPLYYGWAGDAFLFASELRAMRVHPGWAPTIDRGAVALLMRHGYIPAPYSIYAGVYKIRPGTIAKLPARPLLNGRDGGHSQLAAEEYWSVAGAVEAGARDPFRGTDEEATEELEALLSRAVRGQMIADVPLGAFLSGGIDSSAIVALMQLHSTLPVKTFTIGFENERFNEADYAKKVARHLGTDHTDLVVTAEEAMAVIPRLPQIYDEPFADSSQIPTYLVSKLARHDVTVTLSGDGGDELFAGYVRYRRGAGFVHRCQKLPRFIRAAGSRTLDALSVESWDRLLRIPRPLFPEAVRPHLSGDTFHKLADVLATDRTSLAHRTLLSHWRDPASVVPDSSEPPTVHTHGSGGPAEMSVVERMMYLDQLSYLPDQILAKVDRATMAVGLEARMPILDHRVVEFAWRLPLSMKLSSGEPKLALRRVLARHVPAELVDRPKQGFSVPLDDWLRGPMREWASDLLQESRLQQQGFFDPELVGRRWTRYLRRETNSSYSNYPLWSVLMFQAWYAEWESGSQAA